MNPKKKNPDLRPVDLRPVTDLGSASEAIQALGCGQDSKVLRFVLSKTWPFSDGQDPYNMSSLDCMLVVMRHILAQSTEIENPDRIEELACDPLVHLCLRDFSGDTPEKLANMQKERRHVFEEISEVLQQAPSFKILTTGCTLWENLLCNPYHPVLYQAPESEEWILSSDNEGHMPPSIRFETKHNSTIQSAIDDAFGLLVDDKGKYAMYGACPCFLSVIYIANAGPDPNLSIDSVAEVELPRHKPREDKDGIVFEEGERYRYRLIAVVRLRPLKSQEHDYVRIYDVEGNNIVPLGDRSRYAGILNDDWSIADQNRVYMLFYVRLDRPVPEGGPPRIEEVHHEEPRQTGETQGPAAAEPEVSATNEHGTANTMKPPKTPSKPAPPPVAPNT